MKKTELNPCCLERDDARKTRRIHVWIWGIITTVAWIIFNANAWDRAIEGGYLDATHSYTEELGWYVGGVIGGIGIPMVVGGGIAFLVVTIRRKTMSTRANKYYKIELSKSPLFIYPSFKNPK